LIIGYIFTEEPYILATLYEDDISLSFFRFFIFLGCVFRDGSTDLSSIPKLT
jgi:hypothetical protein